MPTLKSIHVDRKWSFAGQLKSEMTYKDFLNHFKEDKSDELCFKESRPEITDLLKNDIIVPDFYKDVAEL